MALNCITSLGFDECHLSLTLQCKNIPLKHTVYRSIPTKYSLWKIWVIKCAFILIPPPPHTHLIWTVLSMKAVYFVNDLFFLTKTMTIMGWDDLGGEKNKNYYKLLFILVDKNMMRREFPMRRMDISFDHEANLNMFCPILSMHAEYFMLPSHWQNSHLSVVPSDWALPHSSRQSLRSLANLLNWCEARTLDL